MAGSFGFESEHYDVSMAVGQDRLFPAVRAASQSAVIAATGVSCRQQIQHGTDRHAWHPVELIRAALAE
jgi:Fe-S oxidoreductase